MKDLSGQKFGQTLVLRFHHKDNKKHLIWECKCACGEIIYKRTGDLDRGNIWCLSCANKKKASKTADSAILTKLKYDYGQEPKGKPQILTRGNKCPVCGEFRGFKGHPKCSREMQRRFRENSQ